MSINAHFCDLSTIWLAKSDFLKCTLLILLLTKMPHIGLRTLIVELCGVFGLHKLIFVLLWFTINLFLMTKSGVTTESGGRQNMFPSETRPYIDETVSYDGYPQNAEKVNGRWAMVGFVALLGAYVTTGQIIPGIF